MASHQVTTTAQPATPASLRAQMAATQVSLNDAIARRAGIQARLDAAGGPAERSRIRNGELRGVDNQIARFEAELAGLQAELQLRETTDATLPPQPVISPPAAAAPPAATTTVPPTTGIDLNSMALGGIATVLLLLPLLLMITWRAGRRAALAARTPEWEEVGARLARMEEAIAATAQEVERVEESQRFLTSTLVADPRPTPVREEVRTRR